MSLKNSKFKIYPVLALTLLLCGSSSAEGFEPGQSPYKDSGSTYGGDSFSSSSQTAQSSSGSSSNYTPSGVSNSSANGATASPYSSSNPADQSNPPKAWDKMEQWFQRKTNKPTGEPETDLANQRINAGKARLRAIKAKEKLDKHNIDSNTRTEELKRDLEKAEEQARLLESQVKLQESNQGSKNY